MPRSDAGKRAKFFLVDSYAAAPLMLFGLAPSWTFFIFIVSLIVVLFLLGRRGMTLPMLGRYVRSVLAGPRKQIRPEKRC